MKNLILFSLLIVSLYSCKAQTTIYNLGTYDINETENTYIKDVDNHHDAIVGTWKWEDGTNSFEITLQEFEMQNYPSTSTEYYDRIFGKYKYIQLYSLTFLEIPCIPCIYWQYTY